MKYKGQQCQDEKINKSFRELHKRLVDIVIEWCKAYNITIDELAKMADTINYEIISTVSNRVPRVFVKD